MQLRDPLVTAAFDSAGARRAVLDVSGLNVQGATSVWKATWTSGWVKGSADARDGRGGADARDGRGGVSFAIGNCTDGAPLPATVTRRYRVEAQAPGGRWTRYSSDDEVLVVQDGVAPDQVVGGAGFLNDSSTTTSDRRMLRLRFTETGRVDGTTRVKGPTVFAVAGGREARARAC